MFFEKTFSAFLRIPNVRCGSSSILSPSSGLFFALLILTLLGTGGCDRGLFKKPLGEEAPPKQLQGVRIGFERGCLSEVKPAMARFMEGTATPESVSANWDCFAQALATFLENVKGSRSEESFTGREIAGFFEFFFLKDVKISDTLLEEILHLKQLAVGGSDEFITRDELRSLIGFAGQMKRVSLKLLPHMRVYALNWKLRGPRNLEEDVDFFEKSAQVLQEVTRELSDRIGSYESSYSLSSFLVMFKEIENIYSTKWSFLESVERGVPLMQKLKSALTGGDEDRIAAREWRRFAVLTARGYVQFLRYYYFVRNSAPANQGTRLVFVTRSIDDLFDFLGDLVREKEQQVFTVEELNQILSKLRDVFPSFYVPPELVTQAMKVKQLFFGGSRDFWTSDDFDRARNKVMQIRDINQRLVVHADYYSMVWDYKALNRSQQLQESEQAEKELLKLAQDLSSLFETSYDLSDLFILFSEIEKVFSSSFDSSLLKALKNTVILMVVYKNILFSDNSSRIEKRADLNQWPLFLKGSLELYALRLKHLYFIEGKEIFRGESLLNLQNWSNQVVSFLERLLKGKPHGSLTAK
ncbi:MAG: hypothetical protein WCH11_01305, partial [Bdellovibrio sp.]